MKADHLMDKNESILSNFTFFSHLLHPELSVNISVDMSLAQMV